MIKQAYSYMTKSCCVLFLLSAILKSVNIHSFAIETADFIDLYMPSWLHGYNYPCAMAVCSVELMLGMLALRAKYRQVALCGMLALLSFFVWLTMVNAFFPTIFGSVESCGCFGELIHFTPMASFVKSVVLWMVVAVLLFIYWKQRNPFSRDVKHRIYLGILKDVYLWISVLAGWALVFFSYSYVNSLDHDQYLLYFVVLCVILSMVTFWFGKERKVKC